jgi:hypothetical protein
MSVMFSYKFKLFSVQRRVEARRDADAASAGTVTRRDWQVATVMLHQRKTAGKEAVGFRIN